MNPQVNTAGARPLSIYYGWWVLLATAVTEMLAIGSTSYAAGLFVLPLEQELHLSRADSSSSIPILFAGGAIAAPLVGYALDRLLNKELLEPALKAALQQLAERGAARQHSAALAMGAGASTVPTLIVSRTGRPTTRLTTASSAGSFKNIWNIFDVVKMTSLADSATALCSTASARWTCLDSMSAAWMRVRRSPEEASMAGGGAIAGAGSGGGGGAEDDRCGAADGGAENDRAGGAEYDDGGVRGAGGVMGAGALPSDARASSIGTILEACTNRSNPISRCRRGWECK